MRLRSIHGFLLATGVALLSACAGEQVEVAEETAEATDEKAPEVTTTIGLPEADAAALWGYLQDVDYQANWALWPGKGEQYEGAEPHGMLLTTYLNEPARGVLTGPEATMPPGAIIVKENYTPDGTLAAITTMYKVEGYNPEAGDWHWVKFLPDGSVDNDGMAQGKVQGCIGCHGGEADNDYVMTESLAGGS